ncbi:phosphoribosyltransferase [Acidithiobacillus ferrooxidans]|uniref:phosphoribosyltransferase n=2 Tax=Acidithiobacillus ferrooxidans TaxID=920 RepID=UPI001D0043C3|nr:phosphoribosyltransferase [Acidithiobacillus ferrooxidans]
MRRPMQDDLQRVPRFPWGDFPDVLRNGNLGELKQQPEYAAAKSGDAKAALSLADRVIRPEFVKAVVNLGASHPRPVLLPMLAEESVGDNRIPLAFAEVLSERLGWQVERDILQINRTWHTNAGADHRLIARCLFDGTVEHDAGYILIDDTLTMGGTLADLRGFIMNKGATLLGATVAVAHEGALHLPIRDKMQEDIYARHGKDAVREFAHEEFGYGIECLTQGEAGHIRKALSLDALRDRFTQARDALGQRVDAPGTTRPPHRRRADKREEPLTHRNLHPPPQALNRNDSFVVEAIPRGGHMAAQLDHLLSYGPMDVVASNDEKNPGLHIVHMDAENRAFIPQDDPLHREIRNLIDKNPHSKGFVANQIHARLEHEGRWDGPGLHPAKGHDAEGLSFSPSMNLVQEKGEALNVGETLAQGTAGPEIAEPAQPAPEKSVEAEIADATGKKPDQEPQQKTITEPDPLADWPGTSQKSPEPLMPPEKPRFERKNPPEVLFANPKGKPYVLDHGDKVTVTNRAMLGLGHEAAEKRRKAVEVGLKAAVDRFGEPVRFQGNRAFLEETVKVAMERGIALEPGSPMARDIYERAIKERGNQLGPSKDAAPYRAPEKKREVDKGKGIGL